MSNNFNIDTNNAKQEDTRKGKKYWWKTTSSSIDKCLLFISKNHGYIPYLILPVLNSQSDDNYLIEKIS